MENELEPCPVCTAVVTLTRPDGRFVVCTTCDQAWNADTFNTLARRAEIGRLAEELTGKGYDFEVSHSGGLFDAFATGIPPIVVGSGATLLDALRSLAAEIGGKNA